MKTSRIKGVVAAASFTLAQRMRIVDAVAAVLPLEGPPLMELAPEVHQQLLANADALAAESV